MLQRNNSTNYFYILERTQIPRRCKRDLLKLLSRCTTSIIQVYNKYVEKTQEISSLEYFTFVRLDCEKLRKVAIT